MNDTRITSADRQIKKSVHVKISGTYRVGRQQLANLIEGGIGFPKITVTGSQFILGHYGAAVLPQADQVSIAVVVKIGRNTVAEINIIYGH